MNHPVECPEYLMEFEHNKLFRNAAVLDAVSYQSKMGKYLDRFRKSKEELITKVKELEEKGIGKDDISDYVWKEESNGVVNRFTIKIYYDVYQIAAYNLLRFIEFSKPVDGEKHFVEKNTLAQEKIDLLIQLRQLELKALLPESVE